MKHYNSVIVLPNPTVFGQKSSFKHQIETDVELKYNQVQETEFRLVLNNHFKIINLDNAVCVSAKIDFILGALHHIGN